MGNGSLQRTLQGVIRGVCGAGNYVLGAEAADNIPRLIELGVGRKAGTCARVAIQKADAG